MGQEGPWGTNAKFILLMIILWIAAAFSASQITFFSSHQYPYVK